MSADAGSAGAADAGDASRETGRLREVATTMATEPVCESNRDMAVPAEQDTTDQDDAGGIWRHDECGPYYYRPMSVWSVLLGYQKFSYDAHKQEIGFLTEDKKHRSIFCIGTGWGIFERNGNTIKITCRYGTIGFKCLRFAARSKIARAPRMQIDGKQIAIEDCVRKPAALTIRTSEHVELTAGQSLKITIV